MKFSLKWKKIVRGSGFICIFIILIASLTGCSGRLFAKGETGITARQSVAPRFAGTEPSDVPARMENGPASFPEEISGQSSSLATGLLLHQEILTEDTNWSGEVVVDGVLTVAPQATLSIEPGTVVRFCGGESGIGGAALVVQGRIVAKGRGDAPVRFTGHSQNSGPGSWQGIILLASEKKNLLENCQVEDAETGLDANYSTLDVKGLSLVRCRTGLRAQDSFLRLAELAAKACGLGVALYDSEADISDAVITENRRGIFALRTSLYLSRADVSRNEKEALSAGESMLTIRENTISGNGSGIALSGCEGLISHNNVHDNVDYGMSLSGSRVKITANDITRNGGIGIRVADGKGIAWGNSIAFNGRYDLYNAGSENFQAMGNWWGGGAATPTVPRIFDKGANPGGGTVSFIPFLPNKPRDLP